MKKIRAYLNKIPAPAQMYVLAFFMYVICVTPVLIMHGGLFFYYGDYNVQQVPFYIIAHRAVRSGQFLWNWNLDLGGTLVGDLSFYLTGSPFFWLSIPFPEAAVPYLMPFLMALKVATASLLSYLYMRRFTREEGSARIGALLFAFSGFNAVNIVFNHFTDAVCFFPLLLLTFDDLMAHGRTFRYWLRFTLTVTLLSVINYYFFFGMVLFLLLYAVMRYVRPPFTFDLFKQILFVIFAGIAGVLIAAAYLNLAFQGVSGNTRLTSMLTGYDLLVYPNSRMYGDFLKSLIMTPDIIGRGTLFFTNNVKNSSLAFYLPMFGVSGIAAYFHMTKGMRDWKKRILVASAVVALIPALNALFSLLNTTYYARWYYMPVFFASLVTALAIDGGRRSDLRYGALWQTGLFLGMIAVYFLPSKNDAGELEVFHMSDNPKFLLLDGIVTAVLTLLLLLIVFLIKKRSLRLKTFRIITVIACIALTMNVLAKGKALISDKGMRMWKEQMLDTKLSLPEDGSFYRVETDDTATNYEMVWGYPTVHCFLSTVPAEIFTFYRGTADISRWVESELSLNREGLRALLSARYFIWNAEIYQDGEFGKGEGVYGYDRIVYDDHGLKIYENKNYIPPGFVFGYYIRESAFDEIKKTVVDRALVKAIVLSDEDADRYGYLMEELSAPELQRSISNDAFDALCKERAKSSCVSFVPSTNGFTARTAHLQTDSLVFFSVPAAKGFHIYVDGEEQDIISADYGMMAVFVPRGTHEIEAVYRVPNAGVAWRLSFAAVFSVIIYGFWDHVKRKQNRKEVQHEWNDHEPEDSGFPRRIGESGSGTAD